jgi:hypothetical protein
MDRPPLAAIEEQVRVRYATLVWHRAAAASAQATILHEPDSHEAVRRAATASRQVQAAYTALVEAQRILRARCPDCPPHGTGCATHAALLGRR